MYARQMRPGPQRVDLRQYKTDQQARFIGSHANFAAFVGGIGSGKTFGGCARGIMAANGYIGTQQAIPTPNLGMITAPTYTMLQDTTLRTFREIAGAALVEFNKSEMRATLANGSEILFRSTDNPERLRGANLAWAMMDEAALSPESAYNILIGRIRQYGRLGYLWLATTPKGRNWIWKRFVKERRARHRIYRAASADNLALADEILQAWAEAYVGDFARQELLGEFVAFAGLIYSEFDAGLHVTTRALPVFKQVVAGVDWGFANPGVMLVGGLDSDNRLWIVHEEYQRQRQIDDWVLRARELRDTWRVSKWYCDPSEPDYIDKMNNAGLKAEGADNTVSTGIQTVKARLIRQGDGQPRLLLVPGAANLIGEFEQYQWRPNRDGTFDDAPVKSNDHAMDALRYMAMGVDGRQVQALSVETRRWA